MGTWRIERYSPDRKSAWDRFVEQSKNATFLHRRDYMEYHRDRFDDHSLLVWDSKERLLALLPANRRGPVLESHGGLTYGGFLTDEQMSTVLMLRVFDETAEHLKRAGFESLVYKSIPHIYHRLPAEEDRYALFRAGAELYRRDLTTVVRLGEPRRVQERRRRGLAQARRAGLVVDPSKDFDAFWPVLEDNLRSAHGIEPVHSLEEIRRLHARFPENVRLFCATRDGAVMAGVVIYELPTVAHAQYTASSSEGREAGALDLIFGELLDRYGDCKYFDFGVSTESGGRRLNRGLVEFKEGFGGRAVTHDFYRLDLTRPHLPLAP